MAFYTVFTKPACPQCDQAKAMLTSKGIAFDTIILDVGQPKQPDQKYITRDELLAIYPAARMMPIIAFKKMDGYDVLGSLPELKQHLA